MTVKIEKGIPFPKLCKPYTRYPWADMEIGDSFFVPGVTNSTFAGQISGAKKRTGFNFTARKEIDGLRVWRIA
jgi:hypothetical protein